jgi:nicotinic acid mononucleotide adenylyltransferase
MACIPFHSQRVETVFPDKNIRVMYLCGADHLVTCGPETIKSFGCVCVNRPGYQKRLEQTIGKKYPGHVHIVNDDDVIRMEVDGASSTKVRAALVESKDVRASVGRRVADYLRKYNVGDKISGRARWSPEDRKWHNTW